MQVYMIYGPEVLLNITTGRFWEIGQLGFVRGLYYTHGDLGETSFRAGPNNFFRVGYIKMLRAYGVMPHSNTNPILIVWPSRTRASPPLDRHHDSTFVPNSGGRRAIHETVDYCWSRSKWDLSLLNTHVALLRSAQSSSMFAGVRRHYRDRA